LMIMTRKGSLMPSVLVASAGLHARVWNGEFVWCLPQAFVLATVVHECRLVVITS
jgi:hypothetical protein